MNIISLKHIDRDSVHAIGLPGAMSADHASGSGVTPEISFSLSDTLIQKIEECSDPETVDRLMTALKYQYARMVFEIRSTQEGKDVRMENYHVKRCKDYIFTHLHGKLSLSQIAEALALNASYLSDLFHRCEKISVTEFIQREKIKLAHGSRARSG